MSAKCTNMVAFIPSYERKMVLRALQKTVKLNQLMSCCYLFNI